MVARMWDSDGKVTRVPEASCLGDTISSLSRSLGQIGSEPGSLQTIAHRPNRAAPLARAKAVGHNGAHAMERPVTYASASPSTDERILGIAAEHVRRFGFERTTVVGVAREAGMTHANVYRYFPSKVALADALTASWLAGVESLLAEAADAPDPADDKLERMLARWRRPTGTGSRASPSCSSSMSPPMRPCGAWRVNTAPACGCCWIASSRRVLDRASSWSVGGRRR